MTTGPLATTLASYGTPAAETLRFNAKIEEALKAAPPPGVISAADLRRLRAEGKSILPIGGPIDAGRWESFDAAAYGAPGGPGRVRIIEASAPKGVYIHLHGGGWTVGGAELADERGLAVARGVGLTSVSISYRLAPEHPWPACGDDAIAGARYALDYAERLARENGVDPADFPVFIGGESAGAHLSAVALLRLRDDGKLGRIRGAVLHYGCFDLRMTPSVRNWGERNMVLSTPVVDWFTANLLGDRRDLADTAEVSPLLADLSGMPPAFFQVGTEDPLLDDTSFMAERWRAVTADTTLVYWPGAIHAFDYFEKPEYELPIARESVDLVLDWLRARIG